MQANFPDRGKCLRSVWGLNVSREIGHTVSDPHGGGGITGRQVHGIELAATRDLAQLIYILQLRLSKRMHAP
jgi:hypothetical protein